MRSPFVAFLAAMTLLAGVAQGQGLADRVAQVRDGAVSFYFAPRAGICGDGETFVRIGRSFHGSFRNSFKNEECEFGPVQVRLTVREGQVSRIESWVGRLRDRDARDLGLVSAPVGARYLMSIAQQGTSNASAKAIFPAVLADSATVWPALLDVAKDSATRSRSIRQEALMWLSRFASATLSGHPNDPFVDDDRAKGDGLKEHAVFVLSQLPRREGVPAMIDAARSSSDSRVRSSALFWLGQSGDPRAIALFESVLRK